MSQKLRNPWAIATLLTGLLACCVLGLYQNACAQQPRGNPLPFANSVEQRDEMVRELKEIKGLLREQNTLLSTLVNHATNPANPNALPAAPRR